MGVGGFQVWAISNSEGPQEEKIAQPQHFAHPMKDISSKTDTITPPTKAASAGSKERLSLKLPNRPCGSIAVSARDAFTSIYICLVRGRFPKLVRKR